MGALAVKGFFFAGILYCCFYFVFLFFIFHFFSLPRTRLFVVDCWSCCILLDAGLFLFLLDCGLVGGRFWRCVLCMRGVGEIGFVWHAFWFHVCHRGLCFVSSKATMAKEKEFLEKESFTKGLNDRHPPPSNMAV